MFKELENAIENNNPAEVEDAVFNFMDYRGTVDGFLPNEIAFKILDLLKLDEMKTSELAAHLLNYFEFEAKHLSPKAKDRCVGFLNAWGDEFKHIHSSQIVAELRMGEYLK